MTETERHDRSDLGIPVLTATEALRRRMELDELYPLNGLIVCEPIDAAVLDDEYRPGYYENPILPDRSPQFRRTPVELIEGEKS